MAFKLKHENKDEIYFCPMCQKEFVLSTKLPEHLCTCTEHRTQNGIHKICGCKLEYRGSRKTS